VADLRLVAGEAGGVGVGAAKISRGR